MQPRSRVYPIADKALAGQLEQRLIAARAAGESYDAIARELHAEGIAVSGETIRQWCHDLNISTASAEVAS